MLLRQGIEGGRARQRANLRPAAPVRARTDAGHIPGAWPVPASDGDPARVVCDCPDCTALGADRPPLEELLRTVGQTENPESA
jgi:hypothetical protein